MPRFVAFLRAINVGGGRTVKMDLLRQFFESLDFSEVETFIASGNVVFKTRTKDSKTLEREIEKRLLKGLGYEVAVFIRTGAELIEIANYKPFRDSKMDTRTACNIVFLADALDKKLAQEVLALRSGTDEFRVYGRRDEPCDRCGTPIARTQVAGRTTWFCPTCQPEKPPQAARSSSRRPSRSSRQSSV